ncbi:hypothetical protein ACNI3K_11350 [Demequina sp. SO4-13]|uniref:hypothetical protein n=1 Tax=Demequina sp. SO4-13 TaxID=3401027 RepID=UPI003AF4FF76
MTTAPTPDDEPVLPDDPIDEGTANEDELVPDDERVVPLGADEEAQIADDWVKADEPSQYEQGQVEGDGFR